MRTDGDGRKNLTDGGGAKANAASYRLKSLLDTASPKDTVYNYSATDQARSIKFGSKYA